MIEMNQKIICPDCKAEIKVEKKLEVGEIVECPECGTEVEILSLEPFTYTELIEEK